ncbi:MAG: type II toxin-antitoxin system RelE/ParE family toxin [Planctomycetota bacterium]
MAIVRLASTAETDIADIYVYLVQQSFDDAEKWLRRLNDILQALAAFPQIGERHHVNDHNYRRLVIGNYAVYYTPDFQGVTVYRILHSARQIDEQLRRD